MDEDNQPLTKQCTTQPSDFTFQETELLEIIDCLVFVHISNIIPDMSWGSIDTWALSQHIIS